MLTMSTVLTRRRPIGRDYAAYFARPYAVSKTLVAALAEIGRERRAPARQRRRDVPSPDRPRLARLRGACAPGRRSSNSTSRLRRWSATCSPGGRSIYTTFLAYDEVAHHSGIERADTLAVLAKVDRQIGRIELAAAEAPRPYRLIVLSDHGQSQGATFLQRYGLHARAARREGLRRDRCDARRERRRDEASAYLSAGLTELGRDDTTAAHGRSDGDRRERIDERVVALERPDGSGRADERAEALPEVVGDGLGLPRADQLPARAGPA